MTAPAKSTPAKSTPAPAVPIKETAKSGTDNRIPTALSTNSILADFCKQYLNVVDEIAKYNADVLSEKDSEWTAAKVMEKARAFASPTDANEKPKPEIKKLVDDFEKAAVALSNARKAVIEATSKELGITLSATSERNPELEAPLKEKRKLANEIGNQLGMIAKMTTDASASDSVTEFLSKNPLPAVGRDQVRTFGNDGKSTPKYRVTVTVTDIDGAVKVQEDGFTKTALALTKLYERGKAPKSDDLRAAWEKAGNTSENTVQPTVEFDDNKLHFVIKKK